MSQSQSRLWIIALLLLGGGLIVGFFSGVPPAARAVEHDSRILDREAWSIHLALYEQTNAEGRVYLPALQGGQAFGRARGSEILVAIRDSPGSFHDPRHENFWPDN